MGATIEQPTAAREQPPAARGAVAKPDILAIPAWAAIALSRVVILVAGIATALTVPRFHGWAVLDPTRSSAHLGWLGNLLAASVDRWDAIHYLEIAQHGYQTATSTPFYPLYPILIRLGGVIIRSDVLAGAVISCASFVIALLLLERLVSEELDSETARATVLLLAFAPLSFFFTAVYTESLFLALSVGAFYAARHHSWRLAALLAAACTATRVPGVLVIVPVAYMWWRSEDRPRRALPWFALAPLPLIAYGVYLDAHGFGLLAWVRDQSAIYEHSMSGPLETIVMSVRAAISTPDVAAGLPAPFSGLGYNRELLLILVISLVTLVGAWRRLPRPYAIYATLVLLVDIWDPIPGTPLRSLDRYALVIFPLWIVAARWLRQRHLLAPVLAVELVALVCYVHAFAAWGFVA